MWLAAVGTFHTLSSQRLNLTGDSACDVFQSHDSSLLAQIAALRPSAPMVTSDVKAALPLEAYIMSLPPAVRALSAFISLFCTRVSAHTAQAGSLEETPTSTDSIRSRQHLGSGLLDPIPSTVPVMPS